MNKCKTVYPVASVEVFERRLCLRFCHLSTRCHTVIKPIDLAWPPVWQSVPKLFTPQTPLSASPFPCPQRQSSDGDGNGSRQRRQHFIKSEKYK